MAKRRAARPGRWWRIWRWIGVAALLGAAATGLYAVYLDQVIRTRFEGQRWALPARVYARPIELYSGARLTPGALVAALERLGYRERDGLDAPATFTRSRGTITLRTRGFAFPDATEPARVAQVDFSGDTVTNLSDPAGPRAPIALVRLEPELIGGFFPATLEDRLLIDLKNVPRVLPQALLLLEDRQFYEHQGISPRGIARALYADLRAARVVQGGSTITQQLVKNYFLTADRTVWRKVTEALMAVMLELHYDKDEILEAYLNEVYLGQVGRHSVHGVAQGAVLYFGRPVDELEIGDLALLAGMVRAPSAYDPRRHPQRARARRDQVLALLVEHGVLDAAIARRESARPVETVAAPKALSRYPAFLDLVRRQLARDYPDATLRRDGLRVFSTLDPLVQGAADAAMAQTLTALAGQRKDASLEGALVVAQGATGEVIAVVGSRDVGAEGFNRALDARRQVGSLVKPAVYLAALADPRRFHWLRTIPDRPVTFRIPGAPNWAPRNADGRFLGEVTLFDALVHSRNVPTVNLGMEVGLDSVTLTLRALGVDGDLAPNLSLLLGAFELTPYEVTQAYHTLSSGGFRTPLRGIQAVTEASGKPLTRYPLRTQAGTDPAVTFLVNSALQEVTRRGTARRLTELLPGIDVAGKTGTSNDQRDSWFAGFTGDLVATAWIGHDDNSPTGLFGASGAMLLWADLIRRLPVEPFVQAAPQSVRWIAATPATGMPWPTCPGGYGVPALEPLPAGATRCGNAGTSADPAGSGPDRAWKWLKGLF